MPTADARSARGRVSPAAFPGRGRQDFPDFDRRSHRRRHDQPRPDGRALAGAGGRRRRDARRLLRPCRRSDVDGRTHAGGGARCARVRPARGGRGAHQHSRGRHRRVVEREAVGQLDGGLRRARRRRGAVRHGAHGGRRTVSGAGHRHSRRQGFAVDEDGVGRGARSASPWSRPCRSSSPRSRPWATCARPGRRSCAPISVRPCCCSWIWARARTGSAPRRSRRCLANWAVRPRISASPALLTQLASALAELRAQNLVLAYHDRSDGGVFATLVEMAFAGHCGLDIKLPLSADGGGATGAAGRVVLRRARRGAAGEGRTRGRGAFDLRAARPGRAGPTPSARPRARCACSCRPGAARIDESWEDLRRAWSETSWRMRERRDEPSCAREEFAAACDTGAAGSQCRAHLRSERRRLRAVHRHRAPEGGRAARAGRQQPDRDGGGVRARGLRAARRAHERRALRGA